MKTVRLRLKTHADRMQVLEALSDNGYDVKVKTDTSCYPKPQVYVEVLVEDMEVTENA